MLRVDPATRAVSVFVHEPRMNQPNDLAIAADGTLYASDPNWEDGTGQLWRIGNDGTVLRLDGMRVDVDGRLYVTRYGNGTVAVVSPAGKVLREIDVLGKRPTDIALGGPDGRTAYVTEVDHTRLVTFRVARPGLEWTRRGAR